jgi:hypothetical protein
MAKSETRSIDVIFADLSDDSLIKYLPNEILANIFSRLCLKDLCTVEIGE